MIGSRVCGALLMSVVISTRPLAAQRAGVATGDSVRVTVVVTGQAVQGELMRLRDDSVFVRRDGETVAVAMAQVRRIDVRRERSYPAAVGHSVAIGAPVGLAAGFLAGTALERGHGCADECGFVAGLGALVGLGTGSVLGFVLGVSEPSSRWERVSRESAVAVVPMEGGGVAVGFSLKP